jgi:hypothetical protein
VEGEWRGRVVHPVFDDGGWLVVEERLDAATSTRRTSERGTNRHGSLVSRHE